MNVILLVPVFLFSLCAHEFAHAWTASKRGDPTPKSLGRLSMHPLAHADMVGTLLLPTLCIYYGMPFFGWAKPVPIDARNFRHGRRDVALVAIAGPAMNVLLALIATAGLGVLIRTPSIPENLLETLQIFSVVSIRVNLSLAIFNMLPIPPLDGFNFVQVFLPHAVLARVTRAAPLLGIGLMLLFFTGSVRYLNLPISYCFHFLLGLIS